MPTLSLLEQHRRAGPSFYQEAHRGEFLVPFGGGRTTDGCEPSTEHFQELHNASQIRIRAFSSFLVALNGCARPLTIGALFKSVRGGEEGGPPSYGCCNSDVAGFQTLRVNRERSRQYLREARAGMPSKKSPVFKKAHE